MIARPREIVRHGFFSSVDEVCESERPWTILPATILYAGVLALVGFASIYVATVLGLGEYAVPRVIVEILSAALSGAMWALTIAAVSAYTKWVWGTIDVGGVA